MPYKEFTLAFDKALGDPVAFSFAGERFTCVASPSLGDTFELMDVPDPPLVPDLNNPDDLASLALCAKALAGFIERMLPPADRQRWRDLLYNVPAEQTPRLIELGAWLAEQITGHPSKPPDSSSVGRRPRGVGSKRTTDSTRTSQPRRRT